MVTARRAARLVALTRVDMVGSTAALAVDGVTAAVGDRRHLAEIVRRAATAAGGSVVAIEGDAAVIACPSTTGAVAVAAEVCAEARAGRFEVRAGVTVGELAGDRSPDLPALDEPLASRLESVERASGPSAITIDGLTMRMLAGATGVETEAVGPNVGPYHRVIRFLLRSLSPTRRSFPPSSGRWSSAGSRRPTRAVTLRRGATSVPSSTEP
jgi:class 3 adenylate cyclase